MRLACLVTAAALVVALATGAWAEITPKGIGLCFGENHAYFLTAPDGWVLDTESGAPQNVYAVFYPNGASWSDSEAVMYSNAAGREGRTPEAAILKDVDHMRANNPALKVIDGGTLPTADGKSAFVRYFTGDSFGNHEAVAYVMEKQTVANIVLNARNKAAFDSSLPAFRKLVGSYKFVSEAPQTVNLKALMNEAHDRRSHPETMQKIVLRVTDPEISKPDTQIYWRSGIDYMRVEASRGESSDVRTLAVIDEPDIWAIDNEKKLVQHIRDTGPYFGAGAPIFADMIHYPDQQGKELQYGHELEYFKSHHAKQVAGSNDTEENYELNIGSAKLTLTTKKGGDVPLRLKCEWNNQKRTVEYISIETLPFRAELFTPPTDMKIVDAIGRAEGKL